MKVFTIPNSLVFSPCKVDGEFWKSFHVLLSFLGSPEELVKLRSEHPEQYEEIVGNLLLFIRTTEEELNKKGHITEVEMVNSN